MGLPCHMILFFHFEKIAQTSYTHSIENTLVLAFQILVVHKSIYCNYYLIQILIPK